MPPDVKPSNPECSLLRTPRRHGSPLASEVHFQHPPRPALAQTTLPSIRSLHAYLSLPVWSQHHPNLDPGNAHDSSCREYSPDQDPHRPEVGLDDKEQEPLKPPKKKRRRQALNCTECKRRKIRCDRSQPCGPCSRRGEPWRCQWHVFEPVDKYVTRMEYDELKARVEELEAILTPYSRHHPPSPLVSQQDTDYRLMGIPSASTAAGIGAMSTYQHSSKSPALPNYAQRTDPLPLAPHPGSSMTESSRPPKRPRSSSLSSSGSCGQMQSPSRFTMTPVTTHAFSPTLDRSRLIQPGGVYSPSTFSDPLFPSSSHHPTFPSSAPRVL